MKFQPNFGSQTKALLDLKVEFSESDDNLDQRIANLLTERSIMLSNSRDSKQQSILHGSRTKAIIMDSHKKLLQNTIRSTSIYNDARERKNIVPSTFAPPESSKSSVNNRKIPAKSSKKRRIGNIILDGPIKGVRKKMTKQSGKNSPENSNAIRSQITKPAPFKQEPEI